MQATLKLSDLLALGAVLIACGGLVWQVQDQGARLGRVETRQEEVTTRMARMETNIDYLVNAERRRAEGK